MISFLVQTGLCCRGSDSLVFKDHSHDLAELSHHFQPHVDGEADNESVSAPPAVSEMMDLISLLVSSSSMIQLYNLTVKTADWVLYYK